MKRFDLLHSSVGTGGTPRAGSERKRLYLFMALLLAVSYIWQAILILLLGGVDGPFFTPFAVILMFFPTIAALVYLWRTGQGFGGLGLVLGKKRYLVYAAVIPLLVSVLIVGLAVTAGIATQTVIVIENGMVISPFTGLIPVSPAIFLLNFVIGVLVALALTSFATFGEELGWRGFLQNKLVNEFGVVPGILLLGLVWGFWHAPIIYGGYNFPGYPLLGAFVLMPLLTIGFSGVLAWLTLRAGSVWPAVIAHASINSIGGSLIYTPYVEIDMFTRYLLFVGVWVVLGLLAIWHLRKTEGTGVWALYLPTSEDHREM
jgi:membrane protease YdiL (CAAX protease family)